MHIPIDCLLSVIFTYTSFTGTCLQHSCTIIDIDVICLIIIKLIVFNINYLNKYTLSRTSAVETYVHVIIMFI